LLITVTEGGTLTVAVSKTGYTISGSSKTATIYYYSNANASTYIITGSGTSFTAKKGETTVGTPNQDIGTVITAIRTDANGAACTIQFGNGTSVLDVGSSYASFGNPLLGGTSWGVITIIGKIKATYDTITLSDGITVNSTADITADNDRRALNNAGGTITITSGTINGRLIANNSTSTSVATMVINGGTINGRISNGGTLTINNGTIVYGSGETIDGTSTSSSGRIYTITINGGTVETTGTTSSDYAVRNKGPNTVNITGGTVKATGSAYAIDNFNGDSGQIGTVTIGAGATIIGNKKGVN
jgi:hypothetical protein